MGATKVKSLYLTPVVPSVTRLVSMEADGAPFTPLPLSVLRFTGIQSYGYTDQRKVETDVKVTEDRTGDLSLRKPRTSQLSHDYSYDYDDAGSILINVAMCTVKSKRKPPINNLVRIRVCLQVIFVLRWLVGYTLPF